MGLWATWSLLFPDPLGPSLRAYESGQWAAAERGAKDVLRKKPNDPAALRLLARSMIRLGQASPAIDLYTQRLNSNDLQAEDDILLGLALQRRGDTPKALQIWGQALELDTIPAPKLNDLTQLFLSSTDRPSETAIRRGTRDLGWIRGTPQMPHPLDQAVRGAERLRQIPGWEAQGGILLGFIRDALHDPPGTAEAFQTVLRRDPEIAGKTPEPDQLRKSFARAFLSVGNPALARTQLTAAIEKSPDPEAFWLLSRVAIQEGSKADFQTAWARAGSYRGDNPLQKEPAPFVGEARCAQCHRSIFEQSLAHRHTQSFYRGDQLLTLPRPDSRWIDPDNADITHAIEEHEGKVWEETRARDTVIRSLVEYAFGTRDRYVTMVTRDPQKNYHIVRMSYYCTAEGKGWTRSLLDNIRPTSVEESTGQSISTRGGVVNCLQCHVTLPRGGQNPVGPETADRAIGCERCHGPGSHHIAAVELGLSDLAIVNPANASPQAVSMSQCNECHILDQSYTRTDRENSGWVRSQGVGWLWSRCNTESAGAFGCTTCHNPHQSARALTTAQYEAQCLGCHSASSPSKDRSTPAPATATVCPVNAVKGCLDCHMPRVRDAASHLDLTDHYIRVRRDRSSKNGGTTANTPQ
jgi:predicted CXXCH cytochrome family protein